ncbi:hypothetical protein ACJX0J_008902, partial [Zea mays]
MYSFSLWHAWIWILKTNGSITLAIKGLYLHTCARLHEPFSMIYFFFSSAQQRIGMYLYDLQLHFALSIISTERGILYIVILCVQIERGILYIMNLIIAYCLGNECLRATCL